MASKFAETIRRIQAGMSAVPNDRLQLLGQAAEDLKRLSKAAQVNALFVCTHNSRRSHFADLWFRVGLALFSAKDIRSESCGTETTECNPRTVASLRRIGFAVEETTAPPNPRYLVTAPDENVVSLSADLFSKSFESSEVPQTNLVAFMCCDDADARCPTVPGAEARYALSYVDPKASDGSDVEEATYDERSLQIAAEMFCLAKACASK
ncbi:MAG: protein-tyrosine-phosphatase [Planctomycetota bacterium]